MSKKIKILSIYFILFLMTIGIVNATVIKLKPSTTNKYPVGPILNQYNLEFENQEGLIYSIPLILSSICGSNCEDFVLWGNNRRRLYFREGDDKNDFLVPTDSYFILSDIQTPLLLNDKLPENFTDDTATTRVLKYESIDTSQQVLTFTDLATGTKQVPYDQGNASSIVLGGIIYTMVVEPVSANLSIDLNADGLRYNGASVIATKGGALLTLGKRNTSCDPNVSRNCNQPFNMIPINGYIPNLMDLKITTLANRFTDGTTTNENIVIPFEPRYDGKIGIDIANIKGITLTPSTIYPNMLEGYSKYGAFYQLQKSSNPDDPETLIIDYPENGQRIIPSSNQTNNTITPTPTPIVTPTPTPTTTPMPPITNSSNAFNVSNNLTASVTNPFTIDVVSVKNGASTGVLEEGMRFGFKATIPIDEPNLIMFASDWSSLTGNSIIPAKGNAFVKYQNQYYAVGSKTDYSESQPFQVTDEDPNEVGLQTTFELLVRIPLGTPSGDYTTNFGIKSFRT